MRLSTTLPSTQFAGKSRIGQYGDKMMEGDYHVGQVLDALKELKLDNNTIVVFASDNGPWGWDGKAWFKMGMSGSPSFQSARNSLYVEMHGRWRRRNLRPESCYSGDTRPKY